MTDDHQIPPGPAHIERRVGVFVVYCGVGGNTAECSGSLVQAGKHISGFQKKIVHTIKLKLSAAIFGK